MFEKAGAFLIAEVVGVIVVVGSFISSAMPTVALVLASIWYLINIASSEQGKAAIAKFKVSFYLFRRMDKKQARAVVAKLQSDIPVVIVANKEGPSVVIEKTAQEMKK